MSSLYTSPVKIFPHKIDQLLDALNRVCSFLYIGKFLIFTHLALHESKDESIIK
jgi:hypothetical protein